MEENSTLNERPGFLRRLARSIYRILRAFVITMLVLAVLVGVAWGSLWLYETIRGEINRSTESVTTRFLAQESRIDILRREVDTLLGANRGQEEQINTLQTQLTEKTRQLDALTQDYNQQARLLEALDASMVTTLANDETAVQNITTLREGLAALQTDFNTSTGQVDALGGELDALNTTTNRIQTDLDAASAAADTAVSQADTATTAVTDMAESLALFRAWELIARARLRLLETNFGLAAADIDEAQRTVTAVILLLPEDSADSPALQAAQTRLTLAAANLPDNPALAAADLETAWDELDKLLVARLLPSIEPAPEDAGFTTTGETVTGVTGGETTPAPTIEAPPEPTATPTPSSGG